MQQQEVSYYRALVAIEQKKASMYANLYTVIFTLVSAIYGAYFSSGNTQILLIIPPLIAVWLGFVCFNHLFLRTLRGHIQLFEEKIKDDGFVMWYSGPFERIIKRKYGKFIGFFVAAYVLFMLAVAVITVYKEIGHISVYYSIPVVAFYVAALVFYLLVRNSATLDELRMQIDQAK